MKLPAPRPPVSSEPSRQRKVEALGSPVSRSCAASKSRSAAIRSRSSVQRVTSTPTEVTEVGRPASSRLGVADQAITRTRPSLVRSGASTHPTPSFPFTACAKDRSTRRRCSTGMRTSCHARPQMSPQRQPPRASRSPLAKARCPSASVIMARTICRASARSAPPPVSGRHRGSSASIRRRPLRLVPTFPPGIWPGASAVSWADRMGVMDAFSQAGTSKRQQRHRHNKYRPGVTARSGVPQLPRPPSAGDGRHGGCDTAPGYPAFASLWVAAAGGEARAPGKTGADRSPRPSAARIRGVRPGPHASGRSGPRDALAVKRGRRPRAPAGGWPAHSRGGGRARWVRR